MTYLEDPDVGETAVTVMISEEAENLKMYCRGGESCCGKESNRLCAEGDAALLNDVIDDGEAGEGDCEHDDECDGVWLQCGTDNCSKSGGSWDPEDDCCERKCSSAKPCPPYQGPCFTDWDCETSGHYYGCWTSCTDRSHFPLSDHPHLAEVYGFASWTQCCRRRCTPLTRCGHGEYGCETDLDCQDGHECVGSGTDRRCLDIDECTDHRFSQASLIYCGQNTTCSNSHGSWSCPCNGGYENFLANVGCSDINECTHPSWNPWIGHYCGSNSYCVNQIGWTAHTTYTCACNQGFNNWRQHHGKG